MTSHPSQDIGRDDQQRHPGELSAPCDREASPGESESEELIAVGGSLASPVGEGQAPAADPIGGDPSAGGDPPEGYEPL
jgi:hypothetical protein